MRFLKEDYTKESVELVYEDIYVETSKRLGAAEYETRGDFVNYTLEVYQDIIWDDLYKILTAEGMDLDNLPNDYIEDNFDSLVEKYYNQLLDIHKDEAKEKAEEEYNMNF